MKSFQSSVECSPDSPLMNASMVFLSQQRETPLKCELKILNFQILFQVLQTRFLKQHLLVAEFISFYESSVLEMFTKIVCSHLQIQIVPSTNNIRNF